MGIEIQYKYKGQTLEKQGISFKKDNICFKGSEVDRKFSLTGLEKTLELQRKQALSSQEKILQNPDVQKTFTSQKFDTQQNLHLNIAGESKKDLAQNLTKGLEKTMEILLKPEHSSDAIPYKLTQKKKRRKKKGQSL